MGTWSVITSPAFSAPVLQCSSAPALQDPTPTRPPLLSALRDLACESLPVCLAPLSYVSSVACADTDDRPPCCMHAGGTGVSLGTRPTRHATVRWLCSSRTSPSLPACALAAVNGMPVSLASAACGWVPAAHRHREPVHVLGYIYCTVGIVPAVPGIPHCNYYIPMSAVIIARASCARPEWCSSSCASNVGVTSACMRPVAYESAHCVQWLLSCSMTPAIPLP